MVTQKLQKYIRLRKRSTFRDKKPDVAGPGLDTNGLAECMYLCGLILFIMKTLLLVRHAKSSWDNPAVRDINRPLNERGLHDAPRMGKLVRSLGIQPDLLVSSPAKRALTTAQFFAEVFDIPDASILRNPDVYEAHVSDIMRIISTLPDEAQTVMLFGHNPTFTEVANRFTEDFIDNVPTCGVVHLVSTAPDWASFYEGNTRVKACYFPKEVL